VEVLANESSWFKHDSNARHDIKIQYLRSVHGNAGYGMFWMLIEIMRDSNDYCLKYNQMTFVALSREFDLTEVETRSFIDFCINTELLTKDNGIIYSESLLKRLDKLEERKRQLKLNGMKGGRPRKEQQEQAPEANSKLEAEPDKSKQQKPVRTKNATVAQYSVEVNQLTDLLVQKIKENNPKAQTPNFDQWRDSIRLMMENDKYEFEQIKKMIEWCQSDDFWKSNILSAKKLREKAGTLVLQMERGDDNGRVKTNIQRPKIEVGRFEEYNHSDISPERIEEIRGSARKVEELLRMRKVQG
jgi:hypothetical protein